MQASSSSSNYISPLYQQIVVEQLSNELDQKIGSLSLTDPKATPITALTMKQAEKLGSNARLQALIDRQLNKLEASSEVVTWLETSIVPTVSSCPDLLQKADRFKLATLKERCDKMMANQFFSEVKLSCENDRFVLTVSDAFVNDKQREYRDIALKQLCRALENTSNIGIVITKNLDDERLVRLFEILSPLLSRINSLNMQNSGLSAFSLDSLLPYLNRSGQITALSLQNYPQFDIDQVVSQVCSMSHLQDLEITTSSVSIKSCLRAVDSNQGKREVGIVITKNLDDEGLVRLFETLSPLLPYITSLKMLNPGKSTFSLDALLSYLNGSEQITALSLQNYPQFDINQVVYQACLMSHLQDLDITTSSGSIRSRLHAVDSNEGKREVGIVITKNLDDEGLVRLFETLSPLLPYITSLKMHNPGLSTFSLDTLLPYLKCSRQITALSLQTYPQFDINQVVYQVCSMSHLQDLDIRGMSVTLSSLRRLVHLNTVLVSSSSEIPEVVVKHFSVPLLSQAHVEIDIGESEVSQEVLELLFTRFPRFNGISLKGCASLEALSRVLAVVPDRSKIRQFQLYRYSVDPIAALGCIDEACPQITNLRIRGRVSGGLMSFVLNGFKNLRDFAVGAFTNEDECAQDPITDNIFTEIHEKHPQLSCLALARLSHITLEGVQKFVSSHQTLQNLRMAACPNISDDNYKLLQDTISQKR